MTIFMYVYVPWLLWLFEMCHVSKHRDTTAGQCLTRLKLVFQPFPRPADFNEDDLPATSQTSTNQRYPWGKTTNHLVVSNDWPCGPNPKVRWWLSFWQHIPESMLKSIAIFHQIWTEEIMDWRVSTSQLGFDGSCDVSLWAKCDIKDHKSVFDGKHGSFSIQKAKS